MQDEQSYEMAAESLGADIHAAMLQEIKALHDVWQKLSEEEQGNVIDRLRRQTEDMVTKAVGILASSSQIRIAADLKKITLGNGVEAVLKIAATTPDADMQEFYRSKGDGVYIVLSNAEQFLGGMDKTKPEPNQKSLELGHEYDQKGSGEGLADTFADIMNKAKSFVESGGGIGVMPIKNHLKCTKEEAMAVVEQLEKQGVISAPDSTGRRYLSV